MTKNLYIGIMALVLAGCSTTQPLCIDDAYHWQDKTTTVSTSQSSSTTSTTPSTPNTQNTPSTPETPAPASSTLEFLNVQDTTVTVRINR